MHVSSSSQKSRPLPITVTISGTKYNIKQTVKDGLGEAFSQALSSGAIQLKALNQDTVQDQCNELFKTFTKDGLDKALPKSIKNRSEFVDEVSDKLTTENLNLKDAMKHIYDDFLRSHLPTNHQELKSSLDLYYAVYPDHGFFKNQSVIFPKKPLSEIIKDPKSENGLKQQVLRQFNDFIHSKIHNMTDIGTVSFSPLNELNSFF
ncbi:hypothetical protein DID77_03425 [Candidatus Marinamargulisbacteria bacterium SCGC AG-439-L15]|nr:hypothetical protein DID77_03425 [Candidatus Marinamargulisbacteria bacterium SCGC AG-439-L15]